ncbi:MAG: response regulator [Desulfovibrionaceae bacterium]|jgi:two-component system response regulator|nr:response regulator [Desulfovibrionaceae bacterium]
MVEDNPDDVLLAREALKDAKVHFSLNVAQDGVEAMDVLQRRGGHGQDPRPDIILLDLNLPRMDGREVLAAVKADPDLRSIPVVVLTTSDAQEDIERAYNSHVNCYITKPVDFEQFIKVVRSIEDFWFTVVKLPSA